MHAELDADAMNTALSSKSTKNLLRVFECTPEWAFAVGFRAALKYRDAQNKRDLAAFKKLEGGWGNAVKRMNARLRK